MSVFVFFGILFPFLMTAAGAAVVFLFLRRVGARAHRVCLGFAGGVMAAATAFSLLVPAIKQVQHAGGRPWMSLPLAFLAGAAGILLLDALLRRAKFAQHGGQDEKRRLLLLSAVTLHNIPEGMAVGLAFAAAGADSPAAGAAAAAVSLGIGLQNLPEGAAVALPLRQGGMSRMQSFFLGALSGAAEPVAAIIVLSLSSLLAPVLPALMAFSAGAMMVVVLCELAPASATEHDGAAAAMIGFALMMALDVALSGC